MIRLLAALLLPFLWNPCGAFLVPSRVIPRLASGTSWLRLGAPYPSKHAPWMSVAGFATKKQGRRKRSWDEDLPTTVGRAAFSSLKDKARDMMIKGAEKRGLDWTGIVEDLQIHKPQAGGLKRLADFF